MLMALIPSLLHAECVVDGVSVVYEEVPAYRLQGRVAEADILHNKYVIRYGTDVKFFPKVLKDHIFAHECAHHRLKHTVLPRFYQSDKHEFDADCDAIKQLKWSETEVNELIDIWNKIYVHAQSNTRGNELKQCLLQN